jgi:hypothetical protein
MKGQRQDHEPPLATSAWGWRYHHTGIPTTKRFDHEKYIPALKMAVEGFENSPFGIEWMRFEKDSPIHDLVQRIPHIAFEVDDIALELKKHNLNVITQINSPGKGVRIAMIEHNGAPIELIEFEKNA